MLQLAEIKKYYSGELILDIPFFQFNEGIYWVKGANGSGKTTLLKMIAGLLPFEGDISFKNISISSKPVVYRQQVSWAEAEPLFPDFITGIELIKLYSSIRKAPLPESDVLTERFNMKGYINNAVGTYSAGMTKKLSLVLAFTGNTPLIVLDEPLITLDPIALETICDLILQRHRQYGTTFLMSSHQEPGTQLGLAGQEITVRNQSIF